ncbi:HPr-rel-A system PqqD family peptide chaperone [Massilia sp. 9096]|uniref:HPr-rel-A system PqqD family peptide chaperone n=1 Tax=Massilia sp. 9096 TaxID=1500894 RepID=UPI000560CE91|nr:HPr-rel-A system PqqD family peptide chaperone [Massilia sp. 9096]
MAASETWSLRPGQTLQHRQWDGEYVLYNDLSGDTHLLDDAAVVLLQALRGGPATHAALTAVLENEFEADQGADGEALDFAAEADALLEHMKRLFLVDRNAC